MSLAQGPPFIIMNILLRLSTKQRYYNCFFLNTTYNIVVTTTQKTRGIYPAPEQLWASIYDAGAKLNRHRMSLSCLLCAVHIATTAPKGRTCHIIYTVAEMTLLYLQANNFRHDLTTVQKTPDLNRCVPVPDTVATSSSPQVSHTQKTRVIDSMVFQCWLTVHDADPTSKQHVNTVKLYHKTNPSSLCDDSLSTLDLGLVLYNT